MTKRTKPTSQQAARAEQQNAQWAACKVDWLVSNCLRSLVSELKRTASELERRGK